MPTANPMGAYSARAESSIVTDRGRPTLTHERLAVGRHPRPIIGHEIDQLISVVEEQVCRDRVARVVERRSHPVLVDRCPIDGNVDKCRWCEYAKIIEKGHCLGTRELGAR